MKNKAILDLSVSVGWHKEQFAKNWMQIIIQCLSIGDSMKPIKNIFLPACSSGVKDNIFQC